MFTRKRIWIAGCNGRLGKSITDKISSEEYDLLETDIELDVTDLEAVTAYVDMHRPDVVINCAGYTDMEACEENMLEAYRVNTLGARNLASASRKVNAKIIYISTDDVFCGERMEALTEFDTPTPSTVYGKSKFAGENMVKELNPKHLIVRSSWVYANMSKSYVETIIRKGKAGEKIYAPNDQISSPTSAKALSEFILKLIETTEYGVYHASCKGSCTRYEFARTILNLAGLENVPVEAGFSSALKSLSRNRCTLLRNLMMELTGIYQMPDWKDALKEYMEERN